MKRVPLTQGIFALVDDEDYERVISAGPWRAHHVSDNDMWYAMRNVRKSDSMKKDTQRLHRFILREPDCEIDHRDGNGLNNQRSNLREATKSQNQYNKGVQRNNTSGYKGVSWNKQHNAWIAYHHVNGRQVYLGYYDVEENAAKAYDAAAVELHGE